MSKSAKTSLATTVQVGGGLLDRTTFNMYDIKKDTMVYAAAAEVSHEVTKTVYCWYGLEPPGDDVAANCWIFPSGGVSISPFFVSIDTKQDQIVDHSLPLSTL